MKLFLYSQCSSKFIFVFITLFFISFFHPRFPFWDHFSLAYSMSFRISFSVGLFCWTLGFCLCENASIPPLFLKSILARYKFLGWQLRLSEYWRYSTVFFCFCFWKVHWRSVTPAMIICLLFSGCFKIFQLSLVFFKFGMICGFLFIYPVWYLLHLNLWIVSH